MSWRILEDANPALNLRVQLYGRAADDGLEREFLLVGAGETFGKQSNSRLFIKTRFTQDFVSAGRVVFPFRVSKSSGGIYETAHLTVTGELTPGSHNFARFRHVPSGDTHWFYDEVLVKPVPVGSGVRFRAADPEVKAIVLDHSTSPGRAHLH